jgi:pre-mRNA-processing factor 19
MDQYWSFVDLRTGSIYAKVLGDEEHALTSAKFHPDGLIFATGTLNADVKIWDLKDQQNVATFTGHGGPVTAIAFSENGYYLATAAEDSSVKLWDLRKLKNFKTIQMDEGFNITDVTFDYSGSYLVLGGTDCRVYGCKSWNEITTFSEHTAIATGVRFGPDADWLASTSMDRSLKIYSK